MSDNDTQESTDSVDVEFTGSHFGEDAVDETTESTETTEPAADEPAEETKPEEVEAEESKETEEPTEPEEAPTEETPDEPAAEKSASELKGLTREERREYFQNLQQSTQREVAEVVEQNYQPRDVQERQQEYMEAGYSEGESLMLARQDVAEDRAQIAEATTQITELNANIQVDAVEARAKYDWLNPNKPESFDKELATMAAQIFEGYTVKDERTQQIVDVKMTPLQVADIVDKIRNSGTAKAQLAAQKAAERQMASAASSTSTAPVKNESTEDKQAAGIERAMQQFG